MVIRTNDLAWQHEQVRDEIDDAFNRILSDPDANTAEFVAQLETMIAQWLGEGFHAVGVQSGLAAEFLTLKALGIGPGDEVVTVPNSDLATTAAISHCGATFVLVDIDPHSHNIDPSRIEDAITPRTKAIIPVHMYGLPAEMDPIREIANRHNLLIIEDATLGFGSRYRGKLAGAIGYAGFFSFATGKVIPSTTNGGMVVTRDSDLAYRIRLLRGYGQPPERADASAKQRASQHRLEHHVEGYNLKLDGMQAALVGVKFGRLAEWSERRQSFADRYNDNLDGADEFRLPDVSPHMRHSWRNYVVNVEQRDNIRAYLLDRDVETKTLYAPPVHLQPVYKDLGLGRGSFPNAGHDADSLLCLPMHPGLTMGDIDRVCSIMMDAIRQH